MIEQCDDEEFIQVSECGNTVWVHAEDGTTVGRFSKVFGMDVHNTVSDQMTGKPQCLHCTHEKPSHINWIEFCELMLHHHQIVVDPNLITIN